MASTAWQTFLLLITLLFTAILIANHGDFLNTHGILRQQRLSHCSKPFALTPVLVGHILGPDMWEASS